MKIGNGVYLKALKIGTKTGIVEQVDGTKRKIVLNNVKYVPELFCNLISLTQAMNSDFELKGNKIK